MSDFSNIIIGSVGDTPVTMDDLVFELKLDFHQKTVDNMMDRILLKVCAKDMNISISDAELQTAADKFRIETGLLSADETNEWLEENGLSLDEFEKKLETDLLKLKVTDAIATEEKMNKLFAEGIIGFEKAKIAEIVVSDSGLAEEIKVQLDEEETDFSELAIKYSTERESGERGGVVGPVNRNDLPDEVAVEVFADNAENLIGPIETNGDYYIIKLIEPKKADPNDEHTKNFIKNQLFENWVNEKTESIGIKLNLF